MRFSALQRAENSSIVRATLDNRTRVRVSVLFSEPKIPQSYFGSTMPCRSHSFSALQRAENSSIGPKYVDEKFWRSVSVLFSEPKIPQFRHLRHRFRKRVLRFQCSSASRKFLNEVEIFRREGRVYRFSALQRAENSSIDDIPRDARKNAEFQCSSASRKFLNP